MKIDLPAALRRTRATLGVAAIITAANTLPFAAGAASEPNPMLRLARDFGTPKIGYTTHDGAYTHSMFEFVPKGETVNNWSKLFTVVASRVDVARTPDETRATILRIRRLLTQRHAIVDAYDVRDLPPPVAYFNYVTGGEINVGVIFSPIPGIVLVQQVAAHRAGVITAQDIRRMKGLVGDPG